MEHTERQRGTKHPPRIVTVGSYRDPIGLADRRASVRPSRRRRRAPSSRRPVHHGQRRPRCSAPCVLTRRARRRTGARARCPLRRRRPLDSQAARTCLRRCRCRHAGCRIRNGWPCRAGSLGRFDAGFVSDASVLRGPSRARASASMSTLVPPVARPLPWPDKGRMSTMTRLLRDVRPGRLVDGRAVAGGSQRHFAGFATRSCRCSKAGRCASSSARQAAATRGCCSARRACSTTSACMSGRSMCTRSRPSRDASMPSRCHPASHGLASRRARRISRSHSRWVACPS